MCKKIALIGSTGSIGRQVLDVVKGNADFQIVSLAACTNKELLHRQIIEYKPRVAALTGYDVPPFEVEGTTLVCGEQSILSAVVEEADIVFVAVTGFVGLKVVLAAIEMGKTVALANKEALVCGGEIVMPLARQNGVEIIPVDSEHSAIWQALDFKRQGFKKLILTASGGPFRTANLCDMRHFSPADALKHPNWSMGEKITVDCATMLNKGFEVIEAHHLFDCPQDRIEVVIHPQSIIHSLVEFEDNSVLAEMSVPDMRQPIQIALTYPERRPLNSHPLDLVSLGKLEFFAPDTQKFPCLALATESLRRAKCYPTALNAASEVAVKAFLSERILFTDIPVVISSVLDADFSGECSYPSLCRADSQAREMASKIIEKQH